MVGTTKAKTKVAQPSMGEIVVNPVGMVAGEAVRNGTI